ncbi:unnamed protein product [Brassica oleracea var. botrytis]
MKLTSSRKTRSLGKELATAAVASVFLVCLLLFFFNIFNFLIVVLNVMLVLKSVSLLIASLFLLLASGVYV